MKNKYVLFGPSLNNLELYIKIFHNQNKMQSNLIADKAFTV